MGFNSAFKGLNAKKNIDKVYKVLVKQPLYRSGQTLRVPGG